MLEKNKILLIGNGPSAASQKFGNEIDSFDGKIVRFNAFVIKGFEEFVGTRTDYWVTCSTHPNWWKDYEKVFVVSYTRKRDDTILKALQKRYPNACNIPEWAWDITKWMVAPSSGAVAAAYFQRDNHVYIYGFDFFSADKHHYGDELNYCFHNKQEEKEFFTKMILARKITPFNPGPILQVDVEDLVEN